jgi:hypothetical protein
LLYPSARWWLTAAGRQPRPSGMQTGEGLPSCGIEN